MIRERNKFITGYTSYDFISEDAVDIRLVTVGKPKIDNGKDDVEIWFAGYYQHLVEIEKKR